MRRSSEQQPLVGFDNSGNRNGSPKTLFDRAIRWGISRKGGERSQRSIWERFPELGRLKENSPTMHFSSPTAMVRGLNFGD